MVCGTVTITGVIIDNTCNLGSRYIELFLHSKNDFDRSQPSTGTGQHGYDQSSWSAGDTSSYTSFSSTVSFKLSLSKLIRVTKYVN